MERIWGCIDITITAIVCQVAIAVVAIATIPYCVIGMCNGYNLTDILYDLWITGLWDVSLEPMIMKGIEIWADL